MSPVDFADIRIIIGFSFAVELTISLNYSPADNLRRRASEIFIYDPSP
ncbi:MAG: hypothetical protein IJS39_00905 [Synergistaceae bacterium]|nr:hypothetical protein [Synergistaceae bacterium]